MHCYLFFILQEMSTKSVKGAKVGYWITIILLALFTLPGLFFMNSEMAVEWMRHVWLEWAPWLAQLAGFGAPLAILFILIPGVWSRLKEWSFVFFNMKINYWTRVTVPSFCAFLPVTLEAKIL